LTSELPHVDKDKIIKAIFDTSIITIRLHNYSRAISQQINRHMSGISQESQRYVDYSSAQFIDPLVFDTEKYDVGKLYNVELFGTKVKITSQELGDSLVKIYNQLKNQGMLSQDARSFLPINVKTKTIHTFTYTNFLHFIKVRTKPQTQAENRCIANEMKDLMLRSLYESVSIEYGKDEEVNKSIDKMKDVYKLFESKILELTK
jgi:flavin-dependent thymidylate synthase